MREFAAENLKQENTRLKQQQDDLSSDLHEEREMVKYLHSVIKNYEVLLRKGSKRNLAIPPPRIVKPPFYKDIPGLRVSGVETDEKFNQKFTKMNKEKRKSKEKKDRVGFLKHVRIDKPKRKDAGKVTTQETTLLPDKATKAATMDGVKQQRKTKQTCDEAGIKPTEGDPTSTSLAQGATGVKQGPRISLRSYYKHSIPRRTVNQGHDKVTQEGREVGKYIPDDDELFLCESHATPYQASCHTYYGRYTSHATNLPAIPYHNIVTDIMEEVSEIPEVSEIDRKSAVKINVMDLIEKSWASMEEGCDTEEDLSDIHDYEISQISHAIAPQSRSDSNSDRHDYEISQISHAVVPQSRSDSNSERSRRDSNNDIHDYEISQISHAIGPQSRSESSSDIHDYEISQTSHAIVPQSRNDSNSDRHDYEIPHASTQGSHTTDEISNILDSSSHTAIKGSATSMHDLEETSPQKLQGKSNASITPCHATPCHTTPCLNDDTSVESGSETQKRNDAITRLNTILDQMFLTVGKTQRSLDRSDKFLTKMERRVDYLESFALGEESECL